ncbi:MAG: hypothetical protein LC799_00830 [Actinobacteria bacterium]|nr:hypothetical protein [Actinomycetota bacterium]
MALGLDEHAEGEHGPDTEAERRQALERAVKGTWRKVVKLRTSTAFDRSAGR